MRNWRRVPGWGVALVALLIAYPPRPALAQAGEARAGRTIAVTVDDLPVGRSPDLAHMRAVTTGLVSQFTSLEIPATGFVNESKLAVEGEASERTALLRAWGEAGLDLGNHTYSHHSLWNTPLDEYQEDVLRGERVTAQLLAEWGERPRYFRHPYLNTGPDIETKAAFERFLAEYGYTVAPVTFDNDEYVYALAYDNATARGDAGLARRIGIDYVRYMEETAAFYEGLSRRLLGREPAQILLLHANALNAEILDELAAMFRARGYAFIALEDALEDPAYTLPDTYTGQRGLSWLQRWAITQGKDPGREPELPEWVRDAAWPD